MAHNSFENSSPYPLSDSLINSLGHVIRVGSAGEGEPDFNPKIEVFSVAQEGDRAQVYQMWAIDKVVSNPVVLHAFEDFGLAGDGEVAKDKEKWTQLVEHIAGVAAIADHIFTMIHKHGGAELDIQTLETAAMLDNIEKQAAVEAGIAERKAQEFNDLGTATLVHDLEKPAELAAGAGGLENSRDNPVLRAGHLWAYLHDRDVADSIILAAQNTGRTDRFFDDQYSVDSMPKALKDREMLANQLGVSVDEVDSMTPDDRRLASITYKGLLATLVGGSDAMAAQFKFRGMTEAAIDAMSAYYLSYKKDPESTVFFGRDWPAYYKINRQYLISQVPEENRAAFEAELDALTHEKIFNDTVLPSVLGKTGNEKALNRLRYPE